MKKAGASGYLSTSGHGDGRGFRDACPTQLGRGISGRNPSFRLHRIPSSTVKTSVACLCLAIATLAHFGCATATVTGYQQWSSQPTPPIWKVGSAWSLVLLDKDGSLNRTLTVRFTDEPAESCIAGDWKSLEVLAERPKRSDEYLGQPAYYVTGSALMIDLTPNLCDNYHPMPGQLTELGVTGTHGVLTMFSGETIGTYYGAPID